MSFEGYFNVFCGNGHFVTSRDIYESEEDSFCFCGNKERYTEVIDQTNGCFCNELEDGEECPACSRILKKEIGEDDKKCSCDNGKVEVIKSYKDNTKVTIDCPLCKGTYFVKVNKYDISSLKR